ncbi:MAG: hypothetical protein ACR5LD_10840 [Symbiopectobacterium sp.]
MAIYALNFLTGITPEVTQFHYSILSPYNFDIAKANKLLDKERISASGQRYSLPPGARFCALRRQL